MKMMYSFILLLATANAVANECDVRCAGSWNVVLKGGLNPSCYTDRGKTLNIPQIPSNPTISSQVKIPKFSEQFDTPFYVGGEVGYMLNDTALEIFTDMNFTKASGKNIAFIEQAKTVEQEFSPFKAWGLYVGMRYHADCNRRWFVPFGGAKLGLQYRSKVTANQISNSDPASLIIFDFFKTHSAVAASLQGGFDLVTCRYFAFTLQAELLFSGPMKSNTVITVPPQPIVAVGNTGTIISIPISLGFKFMF